MRVCGLASAIREWRAGCMLRIPETAGLQHLQSCSGVCPAVASELGWEMASILLEWLVGDGARNVLESCLEILQGGVSPEVGARVCPNALLPGCAHGKGIKPAQTVPLLCPPLPTSPLLLGRLPGPASQQTLPLLRLGLPGGKGTPSPEHSCAF